MATPDTSPQTGDTSHIPSISTTAPPPPPPISPFARPLQRSDSRSSLSPLANQFPHVYHYVNQLFVAASSAAQDSAASTGGGRAGDKVHPLSVSSSTGSHSGGSNSDDEEDDASKAAAAARDGSDKERSKKSGRTVSVSSAASAASTTDSAASGVKLSQEEKDDVVRVIVDLLGDEREEQVKSVLKDKLGPIGRVSRGGTGRDAAVLMLYRRTTHGWIKSAWT